MPTPSAAAEGVGTVVSPAWLADAVKEKERRVRVLDCSWYLPAMARDGIEEHAARRIPGARYFDVDAISDPSSALPHMLPSASQFAAACDALDVRNDDQIVVYDGAGSSPPAARVVDVQGVRTRRRRRAGRRHACMARSGAAAGRGRRGRCHRARGGAAASVETATPKRKRRRASFPRRPRPLAGSLETGRVDPVRRARRKREKGKTGGCASRAEVERRRARAQEGRAQWPRARVELRPVLLASGRIQTRQVRRSHRGDVLRRGRGLERHVHASGGELRDGRDRVRAGARRRAGRAGAPAERTPVYDGSWTEGGAEDSGCPVETD